MRVKKMLLIFNPVAGKGEFTLNLFEIIDRFTKSGFEVTIYPTAKARDAYDITMRRAKYFNYLVCSGGDGTLNEVVDAVMQLEKKPVIGYIPSGTTNDFANTHGLPTDVFLGADNVMQGSASHIDVGCLNGEYFTYVAAFGLFTDVSYGTPQGMKNMLGHAAYILEGVKKLAGFERYRCRVTCGEESFEDEFILGMIVNSKSIAGFKLPESMDIRLDDGMLEMLLVRNPQNFMELQEVIAALLGSDIIPQSFITLSGSSFKVESEQPLAWTIDGEFGGEFSTTEIDVKCRAIRVITP